ncbi:MAG: glycerol-3-phosphate acyltransferase, partial [Clostridia bacterium]|nr:glycerol-3-phosphate acyltransferase [Clostridia bacterium]
LIKYVYGLFAVLGHIYPVVFRFKGGKGIATTIGALLVCSCTAELNGTSVLPWASVAVMAMIAAVVFIYYTEFGAMGSFIAITPPAISNSIYLFLKYFTDGENGESVYYVLSCVTIALICFFTWFAHRKNIERMLKGEEHATSIKEMLMKYKEKKAIKKANKENNKKTS